jgi:hypothetical protein
LAALCGAAVIVLSVALARLYFGAEWLSDIVGSLALGLAWISALGLAFRRHSMLEPRWIGLALVAALSAGGSLTLFSLDQHETGPGALYAASAEPRNQCCAVATASVRALARPSQRPVAAPARQPFDLAYAGDLEPLTAAMSARGWRPADRLSWGNAMKLLSPSLPLSELPVIPHVHDGRHETLTLVKDKGPQQRLVLRLWISRCGIDGRIPVWIGTLVTLRKEIIVNLLALPVTAEDATAARATFDQDLAATADFAVDNGEPTLIAKTPSGLLAD